MHKKILSILIISTILYGCSSHEAITPDNPEPLTIDVSDSIEEKAFPFTGKPMTSNNTSLPFMAIIENSKDARPQSGLSNADIVFETMAEGGISRFIALFHMEIAKEIGPIRSVRPYFIEISQSLDLPFAHCGGSEDALKSIDLNNLMSLNEMKFGDAYWRDNSKKPPHNLYTSSEKITSLLTEKQFNKIPTSNLKFDSSYWNNKDFKNCRDIKINMNKYYDTSYKYEEGIYKKFIGEDIFIDKSNNSEIKLNNIVIQQTTITLSKDKIHVEIPLVGEGNGYVLSQGKVIPILWSKKDSNSVTELKDENGNIVSLSEGKTWWNIVDKSNEISLH
ncbi:DUF3048 domain-containing protein [Clostridium algidicarnis]|uniref:DUF3048 domain-containing protein n=1 Tax=Clostridium algidicarnis TaxID=37659 RepID=UPI001C0E891B|nr:DUF3048 domain-containing protein [Clostridium algidicarnis]MBU3206549.1 DUF3048 domain-containing protein [Clostridium algidicarnis]